MKNSLSNLLKSGMNYGTSVVEIDDVLLFQGFGGVSRNYNTHKNEKTGKPLPTMMNAISAMMLDDDMFGRFYLDDFTARLLISGPMPWDKKRDSYLREIANDDYLDIRVWLAKEGVILSPPEVEAAVRYVCKQARINTLHEYFHRLHWDGSEVIDSLFIRGFGAEDTEYNRMVSRVFCMSVAARVISPGCKVDTMAIIEGKQGIGKSSGLSMLMPYSDWFNDHLGDPTDKDTLEYLFGTLLVEHAELAGHSKRDREAVKAFITRQKDRWRRAYEKSAQTVKRLAVFVGTTNQSHYLQDPTGDRRYLPIKATKVDRDWICANRDKVWAEAIAKVQSGEPWWLTGEEVTMANKQQAERLDRHGWDEPIMALCDNRDYVLECELYAIVGVDVSRYGRKEKGIISDIMVSNGWEYFQMGSKPHRGKRGYRRTNNIS